MVHVLHRSSPSSLALRSVGSTRNLCCTGHAELHLPAGAPGSSGSVMCHGGGCIGCWGLCLWLIVRVSDARATWKTYPPQVSLPRRRAKVPWRAPLVSARNLVPWSKTTLLSQGSPHEYCPMVPAVPLLLLITKQNALPWKSHQISKKTDLLINLKKLRPKKSTF